MLLHPCILKADTPTDSGTPKVPGPFRVNTVPRCYVTAVNVCLVSFGASEEHLFMHLQDLLLLNRIYVYRLIDTHKISMRTSHYYNYREILVPKLPSWASESDYPACGYPSEFGIQIAFN